MIVDVTGFGWSGAGALEDLLREYDDLRFLAVDWKKHDWEFTILWEADGIYDLEHKLCFKHCRCGDSSTAIKRFLRLVDAQNRTPFLHYDEQFNGKYYQICQRYIDDLVQFRFKGRTFEEVMFPDLKERVLSRYNHIVKLLLGNHYVKNLFHCDLSQFLSHPNKNTITVSYNPDHFLERTQQFMDELLSFSRSDRSYPLVTDQLFPPDCPKLFFKYVNEPIKCMIVRRDPRDMYLLAKQTYHSEIPIPVENVDDFILYYKKIIQDTKLQDDDSVLSINYEDIIYQYEQTKKKVEAFVGIKDHARKFEFFSPQQSINNTQLYNLYDDYKDDIKKIESMLPESLYPFYLYKTLGKDRKKIF